VLNIELITSVRTHARTHTHTCTCARTWTMLTRTHAHAPNSHTHTHTHTAVAIRMTNNRHDIVVLSMIRVQNNVCCPQCVRLRYRFQLKKPGPGMSVVHEPTVELRLSRRWLCGDSDHHIVHRLHTLLQVTMVTHRGGPLSSI